MRFAIRTTQTGRCRWELQGSPPEYEVLAEGPDLCDTEEQARRAIHKARTAMRGYKFAKVVVDPDE